MSETPSDQDRKRPAESRQQLLWWKHDSRTNRIKEQNSTSAVTGGTFRPSSTNWSYLESLPQMEAACWARGRRLY